MDPRRKKFLASVLGDESAGLLIKAIDKTPVLEHAIVPRTILAWLQSASAFEGEILDGTPMVFEKSEEGFTGSIGMGAESYDFEDANVFHVGASVAVALGMEELESEGLRTLDIERLGKTIDLMSKAHRVNVELEKADAPAPTPPAPTSCSHRKNGNTLTCVKCKADRGPALPKPGLGKDESDSQDLDKAIGSAGAPPTPSEPKPKAATTKVASTGAPKAAPKIAAPQLTSISTMSLTRSEAGTACTDCGGKQFADDKFVGCVCFSDLAKSIKVTSATDAGLILELDRRMLGQDDVDALWDAFVAYGVGDVK